MFNFTTQTVFNNVVKATYSQMRNKSVKGANLIYRDTEGQNPDTENPEVRIGNLRFSNENVLDIQKKKHTVESLAKVEFDLSKLTSPKKGAYRIALYLGLSMNSQDSFYSNDFVYKGKPLYIEFPVNSDSEEASTTANRIVKIANKYLLFMAQEKILNVSADGSKIIFEGVNGYQQIRRAYLQKYDPEAKQVDCCSYDGDYANIIIGVPVSYTIDDTTGKAVIGEADPETGEGGPQTLEDGELRDLNSDEVPIWPGLEAFGDYNWIIHNLRIPTLANTYYWSVTKPEMPVVGGQYTQFIIIMCVERDGIGGEVVGQRATSVTNHVLYVLDQGTNVQDVENALKPLVNNNIKHDADDKLKDPFAGVR